MNRRHFLGLSTAATAAMVFDPERLLWVPGAKTFFLPSQEIVQAATLEEALRLGLVAMVPNGHGGWAKLEVLLVNNGQALDERIARELADIKRLGGRIVETRHYVANGL